MYYHYYYEQRNIQVTILRRDTHKDTTQTSTVIINNGSKNSKCRPKVRTVIVGLNQTHNKWEEAVTMRTAQITIACTKGERDKIILYYTGIKI